MCHNSCVLLFRDHNRYRFVGVLEGRYYDSLGRRTDEWIAAVAKAKQDPLKEVEHPVCNTKWEQSVGNTFWCTNSPLNSQLVPRLVHSDKLGSQCVCLEYQAVKEDTARYREFDGCASNAQSCVVPGNT